MPPNKLGNWLIGEHQGCARQKQVSNRLLVSTAGHNVHPSEGYACLCVRLSRRWHFATTSSTPGNNLTYLPVHLLVWSVLSCWPTDQVVPAAFRWKVLHVVSYVSDIIAARLASRPASLTKSNCFAWLRRTYKSRNQFVADVLCVVLSLGRCRRLLQQLTSVGCRCRDIWTDGHRRRLVSLLYDTVEQQVRCMVEKTFIILLLFFK